MNTRPVNGHTKNGRSPGRTRWYLGKQRENMGVDDMNSRRGARSRVLIVDNNDDVLNALDKLLTDEGFDTRTTWSGHEALALM